jgi:hypothetical protein
MITRQTLAIFAAAAATTYISGCGSIYDGLQKDDDVKREISFVTDFCRPTVIVGSVSGITAVIDAKRQELQSAQASLEASAYQKLSQELQTYTAKAELLNGRFNESCRIRALCLYRKKTDGECAGSVEEYNASRKDMTSLLSSLEQFAPNK